MLIRSNLIPWFSKLVGLNANAVTLGPFIFMKKGYNSERTLRHEMVHVAQWAELWYVGFLFLYVWDWLKGLWRGYDLKNAYRAIRLEQEARASHGDEDYLANRSRFGWRKYRV